MKEMPLTSFQPFIDLILNKNAPEKGGEGSTDAENSASIRVSSLFPKLLKLSSAASTSALEVFSKDTASHGQLPQKTDVNLKLYKTPEGFLYWTFDILEAQAASVPLFSSDEPEKATSPKKAASKTKSTLAQAGSDTTE